MGLKPILGHKRKSFKIIVKSAFFSKICTDEKIQFWNLRHEKMKINNSKTALKLKTNNSVQKFLKMLKITFNSSNYR